jgi:hypothetical protein
MQRLKLITLVLAVAALAVVLLRVRWQPPAPLQVSGTNSGTPSGASPPPQDTPAQASGRPLPTESATPAAITPGAVAPSTPADEWANTLLDRALPIPTNVPDPGSSLVWWQNSSMTARLALGQDDSVLFGSQPFEPAAVDIMIADTATPGRLNQIGAVRYENGLLTLTATGTAPGFADTSWMLGSPSSSIAFRALVVQAALRDVALYAVFGGPSSSNLQLVLVGTGSLTPTVTLTPTGITGTPAPTLTATLTHTPTPTRAPEAYMGRLIAARIDPVIDASEMLDTQAAAQFISNHPWAGLLTWTESGPQIDGRATYVDLGERLTFYALMPEEGGTAVSRLFEATYDGSITRLPDDAVLFQGQRMEEVLYWMVRRAAERGGQLIAAYDDFGPRQSITLVSFRAFSSAQP